METERDKEYKSARLNSAMDYEYTIGTLWESRPQEFTGWMNGLCRGTAKGYAEADWWREAGRNDQIRDIDIGFLLGLKSAAHQLAFLNHRLSKLEEQLQGK